MISKIIEIVVRRRLRKHVYGNKIILAEKIVFIQGLGCEVNLVRLREKVKKIIRTKTTSTKFLLFIDFKQAYDSVNHYKLFEKLESIKTPIKVINSIRKILSGANLKVDIEGEKIWVNLGQILESMLSPDLFKVYINDLIGILNKARLTPILYADDLAVICDGESRLFEAMDLIETWAGHNDIEVNKKKSGILVIQIDNNKKKSTEDTK